MKFIKTWIFWVDTIIPTLIGIPIFFVLPTVKNPTWDQALDPYRIFSVFIICFIISFIRYKYFKKETNPQNLPS